MDSQILQFLLFNAVVVFFVVGYILYKPKRHAMIFREKKPKPKAIDAHRQSAASSNNNQKTSSYPPPRAPKQKEVELNVIFQFNGHSFDAFEVLGLPAGSSPDAVEKAYQHLIATTDKDSHEFYIFAYKAIRNR